MSIIFVTCRSIDDIGHCILLAAAVVACDQVATTEVKVQSDGRLILITEIRRKTCKESDLLFSFVILTNKERNSIYLF